MTSKRKLGWVSLCITLMILAGLLSACGPSTAEVNQPASFTETAPAAQSTQPPAAAATATPLSAAADTATVAPAPTDAPTSTPTAIPSPVATSTPMGGGTGQLALYYSNFDELQTWLADIEKGSAEALPDNLCSSHYSPDGNWLWCWRYGSFYVISRDGLTRYPFDSLSVTGMVDVSALWLPDSERLILLTLSTDPEGLPRALHKLSVVNRDGTGLLELDKMLLVSLSSGIDLSPDGNYVVYQKFGHQIFVAPTDGSKIVKLTSGYENDDPFWSATGEYIYWNRKMINSAGPNSIYRIKPDGSDQTLIFDGSKDGYWMPVCQHSPSRAVMLCQGISHRSGVTHLLEINLEDPTAQPRVLLEMKDEAIGNLIIIPSPDWSKVFVVTFSQDLSQRDYWLVNLDTGEAARLPDNVYRCEFYYVEGVTRWSPDSRLLALNGTVTPCTTNWPPGSGMNILDADTNTVVRSLTEPPFDLAAPSFWVK